MAKIHPTAIIDPSAKLADDVEVGPYCIIEHDVEIGSGTRLLGHCFIGAYTTMGERNKVYQFASIGNEPQDYSFHDMRSYTKIGNDNLFRECVTIHRGTKPDTTTCIGNGCFFMAGSHVAHNCQIGNKVIMVNASLAAGYVEIGDSALISGVTGIHQFCRVGRMAVLSGGSQISMDLPPFMIGDGRNGGVRGYNIVGLRRAGFPTETIHAIKDLYDIFYRQELNTSNAIETVLAEVPQIPEVVEFLDFVRSSKRGILLGSNRGRRA